MAWGAHNLVKGALEGHHEAIGPEFGSIRMIEENRC
jgi:hypothetical protein